jgi:uncharacterized repeat protein (TIGR01451 family)
MKHKIILALFALVTHLQSFGQFGTKEVISPLVWSINDVCLADLDNDGDKDLIAPSKEYEDGNSLFWFSNDGNGNFSVEPEIISVSSAINISAISLMTDDLDNDGNIDIIWMNKTDPSVNNYEHQIFWAKNLGTGTFGPSRIISGSAQSQPTMSIADIDGDGDLDVVSVLPTDVVIWYENDGYGNFISEHALYPSLAFIDYVVTTDLNQDGSPDVIIAADHPGANFGGLHSFINNGDGTFGQEQVITNTDSKKSFATDLDADGDLDIIFQEGASLIHWLENDGSGNFVAETPIVISALNFVSDMDGDGDMDFIAKNDSTSWYANDGNGTFSWANTIYRSTDTVLLRVSLAEDFNSDGLPDLISTQFVSLDQGPSVYTIVYGNHVIETRLNNGNGSFEHNQHVTTCVYEPEVAKTGDIDGDGKIDIVVSSRIEDGLAWFENIGDGNFEDKKRFGYIPTTYNFPIFIELDDMDNDGDLDVVTTNSSAFSIIWYENDGTGIFTEHLVEALGSDNYYSLHVADLDGDTLVDIVSSTNNEFFWLKNNGNGTFATPTTINSTAYYGTNSVSSVDFDEDGDLDILCKTGDASQNPLGSPVIMWFKNDGSGNFGTENILHEMAYGSGNVSSADINGDGHMDVITKFDTVSTSNCCGDDFVWFPNDGNGNFGPDQLILNTGVAGVNGIKLYPKDMDNDGDVDLICTKGYPTSNLPNQFPTLFYYFENDGIGNFSLSHSIDGPRSGELLIDINDLDGDMDNDVLVCTSYDSKITWFPNQMGGCTDPSACNYSSTYSFDNGTCCYNDCGCTDPSANNFDASATCEDGSCRYDISGTVFFDEDENGFLGISEANLALQSVIIQPGNVTAITNSLGQFQISDVVAGEYQFDVQTTASYPFVTSQNPMSFSVGPNTTSQPLALGLSNQTPNYQIDVDLDGGFAYPCDEMSTHTIYFRNMGNVNISGWMEIQLDTLFQFYQEITPIDSAQGNLIYMSYDSLAPGQMFSYQIGLQTPTVSSIGAWLLSRVRVFGDLGNQQIISEQNFHTGTMICAYDPNDKNVFPPGYATPHYILNDTILEYTIRFQNTGNGTATDVVITDSLDVNLDLSTFSLLAYTHPITTTIDFDARVAEFRFENIMLPDSGSNQLESNGMVSFKIRPQGNLTPNTEINNTAFIYFDNNPPIVTNTTWNTIYECTNDLASIDAGSLIVCENEELQLSNSQDFIETYNWSIDGIPAGNNATLMEVFEDFGDSQVFLTVSNPLCTAVDSVSVTVLASPDTILVQDGIVLTASPGASYQWYLNSSEINGATAQVYTATINGTYTVVVSNLNNCVSLSQEISVVSIGISEQDKNSMSLRPNPMSTHCELIFDDSTPRTINLYSSSGQLVREFGVVSQKRLLIERKGLTAGTYVIQAIEEDDSVNEIRLLID